MRHRRYTGACTGCGIETTLIILDDEDRLCQECLDSSYTQCDICGEYWPDHIEFTYTDDQIICEYCMEDMNEEE